MSGFGSNRAAHFTSSGEDGVQILEPAPIFAQMFDIEHDTIVKVNPHEAAYFLSQVHYLTYVPVNSAFQFLGTYDANGLNAIAVMGPIASPGIQKKLWGNNSLNGIELRRFALRADMPTNSESHFMSLLLRYLRRQGYDWVLSYADPEYGHKGTIYQASNWLYTGMSQSAGKPRYFIDGKEVPPRTLYSRHGTQSVPVMKEIYGDRLELFDRSNKHTYVFPLKKNLIKKLQVTPLSYPTES